MHRAPFLSRLLASWQLCRAAWHLSTGDLERAGEHLRQAIELRPDLYEAADPSTAQLGPRIK